MMIVNTSKGQRTDDFDLQPEHAPTFCARMEGHRRRRSGTQAGRRKIPDKSRGST